MSTGMRVGVFVAVGVVVEVTGVYEVSSGTKVLVVVGSEITTSAVAGASAREHPTIAREITNSAPYSVRLSKTTLPFNH